jgi:hypothetical protein
LIASVIIVGVLAIAVVGGTAYFFYRHVNASFTPPEDADTEFAQARARFAGQKPLIEIRKDDEPILHREGATRHDASRNQAESGRRRVARPSRRWTWSFAILRRPKAFCSRASILSFDFASVSWRTLYTERAKSLACCSSASIHLNRGPR